MCCLMRKFTQFNFVISYWTHKSCSVVLLYSFFVNSICEIRLGTLQDIWSLINTASAFLSALQWTDKVVIVSLVHAEERPQDIHNQHNPQKFGIQWSLGTSAVRVGQTKPFFDLKGSYPLLLDVSHVMPRCFGMLQRPLLWLAVKQTHSFQNEHRKNNNCSV